MVDTVGYPENQDYLVSNDIVGNFLFYSPRKISFSRFSSRSPPSHESTSDEKNFIIGRALSFAYALDAVIDICNGSANSRDRFNTLKNLVRDRLKTDLYKVEKDVNMEFGKNVRDNLKIGLREHVSELGGCGSKNYYEWIMKAQKDYSEAIMIIVNIE